MPDIHDSLYTVIIPVYNSEQIVSDTIQQTLDFFNDAALKCEIVLINDGSKDNSWTVISNFAERDNRVKSINLLKNYGQHTAVLCGMKYAKGDYLITMDDDLQNPPKEIIHLIKKIHEGYDLVFAQFHSKKHKSYRKLGTHIINYLNKKIFDKPDDIKLTNFRIFSNKVSTRVTAHKTYYPYIPGLLLMYSSKVGNVLTTHHKRSIGKSNYSLLKIMKLVSRLLFNYSSYPLKLLTGVGFFIAFISFFYGTIYMLKAIFIGASVPGWTSLIVFLSFFNGFIIIMLGVLGEYVVRTLNQVSIETAYQVKEIVD